MRKVLILALFLPSLSFADLRDSIVATRPCETQANRPAAGIKEGSCFCPDCKCPDCKCSGGECKCPDCKKEFKKTEPMIAKVIVMVNGNIWTVKDMTAAEANAAIKAQGNDVIFLNNETERVVVAPPSWYKGTVNKYAYAPPVKSFRGSEPVAPNFQFSGGFSIGGGLTCPPGKP